jgi:hypothetical protein
LVASKSDVVEYRKQLRYECIIADEAHRARRRNLGPHRESEKPDANNLLAFLLEVALHTKSLLLATATPVQLYPIEAWALLNALAVGNEYVLGNDWSHWRHAGQALDLIMGRSSLPDSVEDCVHQLLSDRLEGIFKLFGQLPDILEDVWIDVALGQLERAKMTIDAVPRQHPFEIKYHEMRKVSWESCAVMLDSVDRNHHLLRGWGENL